MRYAVATVALVSVVACGIAIAQPPAPPDRVFVLHSKATGPCPALDWHIGIDDNTRTLWGVIGWGDHMQQMARVNGKVDGNRHFEMAAQEVGGQNRTAQITGQVRDDGWMVANITGPNISCQNVTVPWFRPGGGG